MNTCLVVLALTMVCGGTPGERGAPTEAVEDRWIAEDKLRHFTLSFAATEFAYGGARTILDRDAALPTAAAVGVALGVGKEVYDVRTGGAFSLKDLVWDVAGVALALTFVAQTR